MNRSLRPLVAVPIVAVGLVAFGGSGSHRTHVASAVTRSSASVREPTSQNAADTIESGHALVKIKNFMFSPMHLTVTAGTKVAFHNDDQVAHTATAINRFFNTGTVDPGKTKTVTLTKPGTFKYHCLIHSYMTATITVVSR